MIAFTKVLDTTTGQIRLIEEMAVCSELLRDPNLVVWLDIEAPTDADLAMLQHEFGFHALTLEDCRHAHQRPKLEAVADHIFMVLYEFEPVISSERIVSREIMVFLGPHYVVTLHHGPTQLVEMAASRWGVVPSLEGELATYLAYLVIDAAVDSYFPLMDALGERLEELEDAILASADRDVLANLFALKKQTLHVRRLITPLRDVFLVLMRGPGSHFGTKTYVYFQDILDHLLRVSDAIDIHRDLSSSAVDLYMTSLSNRTNETMKKLTVVSTVLMTMALIAGIYGMNFKFMPELNWPAGYTFALGLMAIAGVVLTALFRWKRYVGSGHRPGRSALLGGALALLVGLLVLTLPLGPTSPHAGEQATSVLARLTSPVATRAEYAQLQPGMTYDQVRAIIGDAGIQTLQEDSATNARTVYTWTNPNGSEVVVTFEQGRLTSKSHSKLE